MTNRFTVAFLTVLFSILTTQAQNKYDILDQYFSDYDILHIDAQNIYQQMKAASKGSSVKVKIHPNFQWNAVLENSNILADDYVAYYKTATGVEKNIHQQPIPTKGTIAEIENSTISLTFNDNFVFGFIRIGMQEFFIEPLYHFLPGVVSEEYVFYNVHDVLDNRPYECGYDNYTREQDKINRKIKPNGQRMPGQCFIVEYALASDFSMIQEYGTNGTQNHNIGVVNNVQTNYDTEFPDELQFSITEQWLSTCSSCDPWSSTTNAGDLLDSFTSWAIGGFSAPHDIGSLWTRRDFQGSTIGIAWVGTVCTGLRYNCLQDWSSNASLKRVMVAHEIGHNFDANHDASGSGTIMAPSVNNTNNWSTNSINAISSYYNSVNCLSSCAPANPPTANFTINSGTSCAPALIEFIDQSTNTVSWEWEFPGGIPSTSTAQNPLVTYNDAGVFDVTLTVYNSNGTSNTLIQPAAIVLGEPPVADFFYNATNNIFAFIFFGSGANSYEWDFGNGSTSTLQNPTTTYTENGFYDVKLKVFNACGVDSITYEVEVSFPPVAQFAATNTVGCQPLSVTFTNQSSNAEFYDWSFPGGTPSTSNEENPIVIYNAPGVYSVSLTVTNSHSSVTTSLTDIITVYAQPVSAFTFTQAGPNITFDNDSEYYDSILWNFGDGTTSSSVNPQHTFIDNGDYTVTLTAMNGCDTISSAQVISVAQPPIPLISMPNNTNICVGEALVFESLSTYSPDQLLWTFEGGTPATSTDFNPEIIFNNAGTFDVKLKVSNAFGEDSLILIDTVHVSSQPLVSFTFVPDGLDVNFSGQIVNGSGYNWNFGDGTTSTAQNPTHTYAAEGIYTVTLTSSNNCGPSAFSQTLNIVLAPTAAFSVTNTVSCAPYSVTFQNQSSPSVTSWQWTFEGGSPASSTEANPTVTYLQPGLYDVTLTVTNGAGQSTTTQNDYISILDIPSVGFDYSTMGAELLLSNTGANTTSTTWTITQPNGTIITGSGLQASFPLSTNGQYSITQTNTNTCGDVTLSNQIIDISVYPEASFANAAPLVGCIDSAMAFDINTDNADSYLWIFEGGIPDTSLVPNPTVVYNNSGTYLITLIVGNTLGFDTATTSITIVDFPTADFTFDINGFTTEFEYTGTMANNYNWNFGDGTTSTEENPSHTYASNGTYTVVLVINGSCGQDTVKSDILIDVSSTEDQKHSPLQVYPNPVKDRLGIIANEATSIQQVQLYSIMGELVHLSSGKLITLNNTHHIDMQDLLSGVYVVKIKTADKDFVFKVIKL